MAKQMSPEEDQAMADKINDVARQIQEILVENKMAMIPTISLQSVPEQRHILTPDDVSDILST